MAGVAGPAGSGGTAGSAGPAGVGRSPNHFWKIYIFFVLIEKK